jgi:hypothetical protein
MRQYTANQLQILGAIAHDAHHSALTSLSVTNLIALPPYFFQCDTFAESLSTLKSLSLSFVHNEVFENAFDNINGGIDIIYGDMYPPIETEPTKWNLTTLTLICIQEVDYLQQVDLSHANFPHLSSLYLENITFRPLGFGPPSGDGHTLVSNEAGSVEEFIIRHKASLRTLTLDRCLSSYSTYRSPEARRDWSTIWERFSHELTHLVDFDYEMAEPSQSMGDGDVPTLGYGEILDTNGIYFCQDLDDAEMAERDQDALEKLTQVVEEREQMVV